MALGLEEEERVEALKQWWKQYGNLVSIVVLIVSACIVGYRGWEWYQQRQAEASTGPYEELIMGINTQDVSKIKGASDTLFKNYASTSLATLGGLEAGKALFEQDDLEAAKTRYQWVIDNAIEPEWAMIARLNLSQVLIDQQKFDDALKVLDVPPVAGFEAQLLAAQGDVYWTSGKREAARKAYQDALKVLDNPVAAISIERSKQLNGITRQLIEYKLNAVGSTE